MLLWLLLNTWQFKLFKEVLRTFSDQHHTRGRTSFCPSWFQTWAPKEHLVDPVKMIVLQDLMMFEVVPVGENGWNLAHTRNCWWQSLRDWDLALWLYSATRCHCTLTKIGRRVSLSKMNKSVIYIYYIYMYMTLATPNRKEGILDSECFGMCYTLTCSSIGFVSDLVYTIPRCLRF